MFGVLQLKTLQHENENEINDHSQLKSNLSNSNLGPGENIYTPELR